MIDTNDGLPAWAYMLDEAEANATTEFEVNFCATLRERIMNHGREARLTDAEEYTLSCAVEDY